VNLLVLLLSLFSIRSRKESQTSNARTDAA
jgi:hypothetical protein